MTRILGIIAVAALGAVGFSQAALADSDRYSWVSDTSARAETQEPREAPREEPRGDDVWYRSTGGVPCC